MALIRQTFMDADWYYNSTQIIEKYPEQNPLIPFHPSLSELSNFRLNRKPILFVTKEEHGALRSLKDC